MKIKEQKTKLQKYYKNRLTKIKAKIIKLTKRKRKQNCKKN